MDWNRIEEPWKNLKAKNKQEWAYLADDDLDNVAGKREQLEGKIQERAGQRRGRKKVDDWLKKQQ
ncbi:MAG: CsbD family protein [Methylocella sp.]